MQAQEQLCNEGCGVVILNWNGHQETLSCLAALFNGSVIPRIIVICDNGSTDGSFEIIKSFVANAPEKIRSRTMIINNKANLGYAAGVNAGIRVLIGLKVGYVWILNNDTTPDACCLQELTRFTKLFPFAGIIGSTIVRHSDGLLETAGGFRYNRWTTAITPIYSGLHPNNVKDLPDMPMNYIHGCSMYISADVLKAVGPFNEKFFLFYEELDFCTRANKLKKHLYWCRGSVVTHVGGSSRERLEKRIHGLTNYHENISNLIYTREAFPHLLPIVCIKRLVGRSIRFITTGRIDLLRSLFQAFFDFFKKAEKKTY